jgi:hypothetical protein
MFHGKNFLFSYVLWVKVWIEAEQRFKENEYIFTRSDISVILPYCPAVELLDTKLVMIREFRSPAVTSLDMFMNYREDHRSGKGNLLQRSPFMN